MVLSVQIAETIHTDNSGEFCLMLEPGHYTMEVKSDVVFAPKSRRIHVVDHPLDGIKFIQKKVNLAIAIQKLPQSEWGDVSCRLRFPDDGATRTLTVTAGLKLSADGNTYRGVFESISPQEYHLEVHATISPHELLPFPFILSLVDSTRRMVLERDQNENCSRRK